VWVNSNRVIFTVESMLIQVQILYIFFIINLVRNQHVDHAVQVVEKGEQVENQLAPALGDVVLHVFAAHNGGWVVEAGDRHSGRSFVVAPSVVGHQG